MKKILIIHPEGNVNNNPNLSGLVKILSGNYQVDIWARKRNFYQFAPCEKSRLILRNAFVAKVISKVVDFAVFFNFLVLCDLIYKYFVNALEPYDLVMGVDRQGIIDAWFFYRTKRVPYGLISYEIFFQEEAGAFLKNIERKACSEVAFAVCQDTLRSHYLAIENKLDSKKIITFPVAGNGIRRGNRSNYLHDKFNINYQKKIAIVIGSIEPWTMINELVYSLKYWPENWELVIHGRYGVDSKLMNKLRSMNTRQSKLHISKESFSEHDDLQKILHAADLGIALYKPVYNSIFTGNNVKYMGMSSGKIATYLQHGLPILVNEIGQMSEYTRNHNLGLVVDDINSIPKHIRNFDSDSCRDNCCNFFEDYMDLSKKSLSFLMKIAEILD